MNKAFRFLFSFLSLILILCNCPLLQSAENSYVIYSTLINAHVSFDQMVNDLSSYDVVYLGEQHDDLTHHQSQKKILQAVVDNVGPIALGMEFIDWTKQEFINQYIYGQISREEFLKQIEWGSENFSFDFYDPLIKVAHSSGGHVFGINAPRWLTSKIAKTGINSLTEYEFSFMPIHFQLGGPLYFERFKQEMEGMNHPVPPAMMNNLFEAQSVWDETMSFYSVLNLKHSFTPFFIIVGNFHIAYKLGSPSSMANRLGPNRSMVTVYHVNAKDLSQSEIEEMTKKHERYGYLADYILFTNLPVK